ELRFYARGMEEWADGLDGRCVAARYDDAARSLDVRADPLGAYPVYAAEGAGTTWISNSPEALRALTAERTVDLDALAGLLAGGWPLGGRPLWAGVRRLERGALLRLAPGGPSPGSRLLPASELAALCGRGLAA